MNSNYRIVELAGIGNQAERFVVRKTGTLTETRRLTKDAAERVLAALSR